MQTDHPKPPIPAETVSPPRANEPDASKHLPIRLVVVALMFTGLMLALTIWSSYDSYRY
ncbi:MAG: hypothetical protein ABJA18_09460 [bacterium]